MGLLMTALKHQIFGGSLIIKVEGDQQIRFLHSRKPPRRVTFLMQDRLIDEGKPTKVAAIIEKNYHNLQGTSKPVHICIAGVDKNVNLLERYKADKDAESLSTWASLNYQAGWQARDAMFSGEGVDYNKQVKLLGLGIIAIMVVNIVMMWQILEFLTVV